MMSRTGGCEVNAPYPAAKADRRNEHYARILSLDYAGCKSEMTAVAQYFYNHIITEDKEPDLSRAFECISIVEMRHLELLGEMIISLGGDPVIGAQDRRNVEWWSGRFVPYETKRERILRAAINAEKDAIETYRRHCEMINDCGVRRLINRIIADEEKHLQIFDALLHCRRV
jgi:bacterioferritin